MARVVTFGRHATSKPEGMFREIIWPQLALLDKGTNEGIFNRILTSDGGDSRTLPRTWFSQFAQAPGHEGSVVTGNIDEMTLDGETGLVSGKGWALDSDDGRKAVLMGLAQALRHNSLDLAEVKVEFEEHGDFFSDDFYVDLKFVEWKLASTTSVGIPAFADAEFIVPDEVMAALEDDSPVVMPIVDTVINIVVAPSDEEVTASAAGLPKWDYFHVPEPPHPQPVTVGAPDENGWIPISGNLALWNQCHEGIEGACVIPPRPSDNFAHFNQPGVLTDRGIVNTGPVTLYGGHVSWKQALDDPKNVWADVTAYAGQHGPWICGVVRPDVAEETAKVYAARASRISGHWKGGELKVIASVNVPGFNVPSPSFAFTTNESDEVDELVASYPGCAPTLPEAFMHLTRIPEAEQRKFLKMFTGQLNTATATSGSAPFIIKGPATLLSPDAEETLAAIEESEEVIANSRLAAGVIVLPDGPTDEDLALALELEG